jgi:hypothetical protein
MQKQTGFLGVSGLAWGVIGGLLFVALVVLAFFLDIGTKTL